jgi:hypothetical protein
MTRQEANIQILRKLVKAVKDNPQLRFGQILAYYFDYNSPIFYTESTSLLDTFNTQLAKLDVDTEDTNE